MRLALVLFHTLCCVNGHNGAQYYCCICTGGGGGTFEPRAGRPGGLLSVVRLSSNVAVNSVDFASLNPTVRVEIVFVCKMNELTADNAYWYVVGRCNQSDASRRGRKGLRYCDKNARHEP